MMCKLCSVFDRKRGETNSSNTEIGGEKGVGCGTFAENNANYGWETPGDGPADKTLRCFSTSPLLVIHAQTSAKS